MDPIHPILPQDRNIPVIPRVQGTAPVDPRGRNPEERERERKRRRSATAETQAPHAPDEGEDAPRIDVTA